MDTARLHVGCAEISLARWLMDETRPSRWVINVPDDSMWKPLQWIINMSLNRTQADLIPGVVDGVSAGNSEVHLDPIESAAGRPELAKRWVDATGIEPGPKPMVLGVSWIADELLVPLPYLRATYELLLQQMAPHEP